MARVFGWELNPVQLTHLLEVFEGLRGLLGIDDADGDADVDEDVVANLRLGGAGEADLLDDTTEADAGGTEQRIIAYDIEDFAGDSEAHWGEGVEVGVVG